MHGWLYILECANGRYYIGSTNNLERRILQHEQGKGANFTKKNLPVKLVYSEYYLRVQDAYSREKKIQKWTRKKKKALVEQDIDLLKEYARCQNESRHDQFNE